MEVFVAFFLVVPAVIHTKVVVYHQDDPPYRRGVVWMPFNTTNLWFLPATENVTINARYNDGLGTTPKWFDKEYNASAGLWTKVSYGIFRESPKSKLELHFVNRKSSRTLTKFNTGDPGDLWSVHLVYENGTIIWSEQDPQLINIIGFVNGGNGDATHSSNYKSLSHSMSDAECSCVLPIFYWLLGIFLVIIIVLALVVLVYKFLRKRSDSSSVLTRSSKYEVTVTRTSLNHSASAASRLSATDFQSEKNSKYLPTEGEVTKPYETNLRPLIRSNSRPQSTPVALSVRHSRPQSQFVISEKHPIPCTMVIQPPTPPPDEVVTPGLSLSLGSLQPSASLDDFDDFSSYSDRSCADGKSDCSVNNSLNTRF